MKKDTQTTKVLFLIEKPEGDLPCNVFAFFPDEKYNTIENGTFTCYAHIGQHSACHIDYANKCLQATQEQYNDLKIELEGLGYDLEVLNEQPPAPLALPLKSLLIKALQSQKVWERNDALQALLNIPELSTLLKENEQLKAEIKQLKGYQAYVALKIYVGSDSILTFGQWLEMGEPEE